MRRSGRPLYLLQLASQHLAAGNNRMAPRQRSIAEGLARGIDYPGIPLGAAPPPSEVRYVPVSDDLPSVPEIRHPWIIEPRRGAREPEIRRQCETPADD